MLETFRARTEITRSGAEDLFRPRAPGTGAGSKIGLFVAEGVARGARGNDDGRGRRRAPLPPRYPPRRGLTAERCRQEPRDGDGRARGRLLDSPDHGTGRRATHPRGGAGSRLDMIARADSLEDLEAAKVSVLGRKARFSEVQRSLGSFADGDRRSARRGGERGPRRSSQAALEDRRDSLAAPRPHCCPPTASTSRSRAAGLAPDRCTPSRSWSSRWSRSSRAWDTGSPRVPRSRTSGTTSRHSTSHPTIPPGR